MDDPKNERLDVAAMFKALGEPPRRYTVAGLETTTCYNPEVAALPAEEKNALDGRVLAL